MSGAPRSNIVVSSYYYFFIFLSANCRATIPEKKAITSRACYFFKEMTVYRVHSNVYAGRLKSNFLFHKTIWRFLVYMRLCVYVYVLVGALAADRNNRYYLILTSLQQ